MFTGPRHVRDTIQWDIDPRDWALRGENAIIDNVLANAHNGGIIEEHLGGGPRGGGHYAGSDS